MHICNAGGSPKWGNYEGKTFRGRSGAALDQLKVSRTGEVTSHDRLGVHVWNLVKKMLEDMGYVK